MVFQTRPSLFSSRRARRHWSTYRLRVTRINQRTSSASARPAAGFVDERDPCLLHQVLRSIDLTTAQPQRVAVHDWQVPFVEHVEPQHPERPRGLRSRFDGHHNSPTNDEVAIRRAPPDFYTHSGDHPIGKTGGMPASLAVRSVRRHRRPVGDANGRHASRTSGSMPRSSHALRGTAVPCSRIRRWFTDGRPAHVRGEDPSGLSNQTEIRETIEDLGDYFREGLNGLLAAFREAPDDLQAMVFLNDAPPPKLFWARRQTHENTIHMIDALSAAAGSVPSAADAEIDSDVALDGIDELLCGFFTRGKSKLFDGTEFDVLVAPTDSDCRWRLHVAERMTVDDPGARRRRRDDHGRAPSDLPCTLESRRRDRGCRRRHAARAMAGNSARGLELTRAQIAAQLPTTVRGSAQPASTPLGSTTIAWAWPKPLSKAGVRSTKCPRRTRSSYQSSGV